MRVGILDLLGPPARRPVDIGYQLLITKQFASITPQAISVWCRRQGHRTFYATYHGLGRPDRLLPADLDVVFISCYTQVSHLAYALAKLYRRAGVRTVIGGPHAKAFPVDCLRFFDLVVRECDAELIADIVAGQFDPGAVISSAQPFDDVPTVEERMPEIRSSAFFFGRKPLPLSAVPMLASMGCPYQCNFCIDWNSTYRPLSTDRLATDLRYLARELPGTVIVFHDPNFAVKFDQIFEVLEAQPPERRPPYIIESSLTVLRGDRPRRLKETNCVMVAPGVESWTDYSNKAGVGRRGGLDKVDRVATHFAQLAENVPYLQANFIFGLDTDQGDEPVELTKAFMDRAPFAWPTINIPVPFGGTPLHDELAANGRILTTMPFSFYYAPYLVTTIKHYDPVTYYDKLVDLYAHAASPAMLRRRLRTTSHRAIGYVHRARTASFRSDVARFRQILGMLRSDPNFLAFHEGRSTALPEYYRHTGERMLGRYAELLSPADRTPDLSPAESSPRQLTIRKR
ncbi:MAG TPA: radical SAM protein [Actinophytocola sp.]|uniref:B12-binding domain-containing radical SAM protein n=1 Tax=Actinophytocola sp. TaxID=1872138 RepID=UPI002DBA8EF3|nr:radical SAM protein [Actinophytocola sp.]HEU5475307.1 radical SAM protein [Actinophytocola sp.]